MIEKHVLVAIYSMFLKLFFVANYFYIVCITNCVCVCVYIYIYINYLIYKKKIDINQ